MFVVFISDDPKTKPAPKELGFVESLIASFQNSNSNVENSIKQTRQSKWYPGHSSTDEENTPQSGQENRQNYETTTHNFHDYFTTPTTTTTTAAPPGSGTARTAALLLYYLHALRASGILRSELDLPGDLPLDSRSAPSSICGCDEEIQQLQHSILLLQESVRQLRNVVHADEVAQFHGDIKPSK